MKSGKKKIAKKKVSHEDIIEEFRKFAEEFKKSNPSYPIIIPYYPRPYYPDYPAYPYYPQYPYYPTTYIPTIWWGNTPTATDYTTLL